MIRNKTIKFNMDKEEDRVLWEWLSGKPHGYFSDEAKRHFTEMMINNFRPPYGFINQTKPEKMKEIRK